MQGGGLQAEPGNVCEQPEQPDWAPNQPGEQLGFGRLFHRGLDRGPLLQDDAGTVDESR
jgi:hypothetical protein